MALGLAVAGGVAGAGSLYQMISGAIDKNKGRQQIDALGKREAYKTPQAIGGATTVAQNLAQEGTPQASINMQRQLLERQQATALQNTESRRGGLIGVGATNQSLADAYTGMAVADAQARIANQQNYQQQLNLQGQYQEKELLDRQGNYDVARAEALGRIRGGQQRVDSGIQSAVNTASFLVGSNLGGGGAQNPVQQRIMPMRPLDATTVTPNNQMGLQTNYTPANQIQGIPNFNSMNNSAGLGLQTNFTPFNQ